MELQFAKESRTMKISIKCDNLASAKKLIDKKADLLYFGTENDSCRFNNYINLETAKKLIDKKADLLYFGIENFSCRFNNYINLETLREFSTMDESLMEQSRVNDEGPTRL